MTNWKDIHPDFTEELQKEWEEKGFSYEKTKEWIDSGLNLSEHRFAYYLEKKGHDARWLFFDLQKLRKEYSRELEVRYEKYGRCSGCNQPNTGRFLGSAFCQFCNLKRLHENFKRWTSGKQEIDKFIQKYQLESILDDRNKLKWIPYEEFADIEYLAEGGFGKVYKTSWDNKQVALKSLNNSRDITTKFLQEVANHRLFDDLDHIVRCYGISQDPKVKNYIMVMEYIEDGNLRQYLQKTYSKLSFEKKLNQLYTITEGLNSIHKKGLVHKDFHAGNILSWGTIGGCYITDLGLCKPANEVNKKEKVYGVLPYIAPEVLQEKNYTQAADIYSWGVIAYEVLSGLPPYHDLPHDEFLGIKICQGLRPKFQIKLPQLLKDLVDKCLDSNPSKRPTAESLERTLDNWRREILSKSNTEFYQQYKEKEWFLNNLKFLDYDIHPQAFYTSRLLDFKNLPKPQNSQEVNDEFYSSFAKLDIKYNERSYSQTLEIDLAKLNIKSSSEYNKERKLNCGREKRQLSLSSQTEPLPPTKSTKLTGLLEKINIDGEQEYSAEPMETEEPTDWTSLPNFTNEQITQWQSHNFSPSQTQDWLSIGLQPTDYSFATYLRDQKQLTPEEVLNHGNLEQLNQAFFNWWQAQQFQTQIEVPPKNP